MAQVPTDPDLDELRATAATCHFKFEQRGKRRIHKKPNMAEIGACRPWLDEGPRGAGQGLSP